MSSQEQFLAAWSGFHTGVAPIGWALRDALPERWVRFHSLPGSKRYATTEAESLIIAGRYADLAEAVLSPQTPCWLVAWFFAGQTRGPGALQRIATQRLWQELETVSLPTERVAWDGRPVDVITVRTHWHAARFAPTLQQVADNRLNLLWMSASTGAIFAPYDGGTDCYLPDTAERQRISDRFAGWRSDRPDGL